MTHCQRVYSKRRNRLHGDFFSCIKKRFTSSYHGFSSSFRFQATSNGVKTTFRNGDLKEEVYIKQPEGFSSSESKHLCASLIIPYTV